MAVSEIKAMRRESRRRSVLLFLIVSSIPSLVLASSWAPELNNLLVPLGGPVSHILHAFVLWMALFGALLAASLFRTRRILAHSRPVSDPVRKAVREFADTTGTNAEGLGFGGAAEDGFEAVSVGKRNVIRIGTLRELECVKNSDRFRFGLAHEFAHLGSGDPRTESILAAAYIAGGAFVLSGIGRVFFSVIVDLLALMHLGFDVILFTLRGTLPALAANLTAFGVLIVLLFAERRSARRLREFHADAVARNLSGTSHWNASHPQTAPRKAIGFLAKIAAVHPSARDRLLAFQRVGIAFQADQLLFLLQSYFGAMILEITLQLIFVMASPGVSTLEMRHNHLASMLASNPVSIVLIVALATAFLTLSQYLVLERLAAMAREVGGFRPDPRLFVRAVSLAMLGAFLALASSQSTYFQLSQLGWSVLGWVEIDPDRLTLYGTLLTAWAFAAFVMMVSPQIASMPVVRALLALFPPALLIVAGVWFYG